MKIKTIQVGPIDTNCYIVSEGDRAIVIDPGEDANLILNELGGLNVEKIILTHLHFDHIIAVRELKSKLGATHSTSLRAKVYCCKDDLEILDENLLNKNNIDVFLDDGDSLKIENSKLKIVFTPGHTPGSICLYNKKDQILFSGDTIFAGSIGVTHYKGGNFGKIKESIENKLLTLPDDTKVYPGHGRAFILGDEKEAIKALL